MDTQGRRNIDPADQWVLDPETGTYQLRLEPGDAPSPSVPTQGNARGTAERSAEPSDAAPPGDGPSRRGRRAARNAAAVPAGPRSRRRTKQGMSRGKKVLAWTGGVLGFVVIAASVGGYLVYEHINGNITTVDVGDAGSKSVTHEGPMNILVIGTDSRQGLGGKYGDTGSVGHADTTIVFHVSADRSNATAVSVPRDIVTAIPDCPTRQEDGSTKVVPGTPMQLTTPKFNESLGQDGRDPGCTMRLVSQMTGLRIDHFMMVNFEAVRTLSTAVGGVDVCLARPLVDPKSHLNLSSGPHKIQGEQALEFVRTRHALQNQSDLDRIKLQQNFLSAMIRQIKSSGTLTNPSKLWTLANAATRALTVDSAIGSVSKLSSLAKDLSKVDTKHITFTTLPVVDNPNEKIHATVVVDPVKAPQLLSMVRNDVSLTEVRKAPAAPDPRLVGPKAAPHDTRVNVRNGSGVIGAAQDTVNWLQNEQGVNRSANAGNAPAPLTRTTLEYAPNQADQARSLAAMMGLPATALHQGTADAEPLAYMTLTLGADFTRPGAPIGTPTTVPDGVQKTEADSTACVG
ncbi:LCP family protein [Actinacidiphila sp. ITFR-21]|uniref:LCP family protein n=1 Tax=Actinacidiphila sp. ITFR-21 TaxID=3075199 RepID=UPI00288BC3F0|nr:LCP family protein [Streptomyces sp. ITFR-21]WNI15789.1 LCP family protein [Streptomyces sp. ITFR-21]